MEAKMMRNWEPCQLCQLSVNRQANCCWKESGTNPGSLLVFIDALVSQEKTERLSESPSKSGEKGTELLCKTGAKMHVESRPGGHLASGPAAFLALGSESLWILITNSPFSPVWFLIENSTKTRGTAVVQQVQVLRKRWESQGERGKQKGKHLGWAMDMHPQFMDLPQSFASRREGPFQSQKIHRHQKSCWRPDTSS